MFKLYRKPQQEEMIVIGADPADGGSDYCAAVAKSKKQADSLMLFHARLDSAQFGYELYKMAKFLNKYTKNWATIGVERNTGSATINVLQTLNYPQLFRMPDLGVELPNTDLNKIGWVTNTQTRPKMLDDLALAIKQGATRIYDEETIKELFSFIRNPRNGRPEAAVGSNDDLVIAEAIAWQLYSLVRGHSKSEWGQIISQFPRQDLFKKDGSY
jgi:hypothetical protein